MKSNLQRGERRLLIVDPADELRNLLKTVLELTANQIILAREASEGLRLAREERPDAIVAACGRHAVGTELCRSLRREPELASTPLVLLTTSSNREKYPALFECGCDEILPVPFRCKELLAAVDRAMLRNQEYARQKIQVLYRSGETGFVDPKALGSLIAADRLLCFRRQEGVVLIGRDPVRSDRRGSYAGPERRIYAA